MSTCPAQTDQALRDLFIQKIELLKLNREKVPLSILKTKYKNGYDTLCKELKDTGSKYARQLTLSGIRIHKDYIDEGSERINRIIEESGIMKQLSKAVFSDQNIDGFESLCKELRARIQNEAETLYQERHGLYITEKHLVTTPDTNNLSSTQNNFNEENTYELSTIYQEN